MKCIQYTLLRALPLLAILASCTPASVRANDPASTGAPVTTADPASTAVAETTATIETVTDKTAGSIRFMAVGDMIAHDTVNAEALRAGGGSEYNYGALFSRMQPLLDQADLAFVNQESMANPAVPASGYPNFNAPDAFMDAIARAGFDLVSIANNHSLDTFTEGLEHTARYWKVQWPSVAASGYRAPGQTISIELFPSNDLTVSFAAFTYRGKSIFTDDSGVMLIDSPNFDEALRALCAKGDINIVSLHTGVEDSKVVTAQDEALAQKMLDAGVEIVLMHHSHVLKGLKSTVNSEGNDALVVWSLGNFLHSQLAEAQRLGGIFDVTISKREERIVLSRPVVHPFYLWYRWEDPARKDLLSRRDLALVPLPELGGISTAEHLERLRALALEVFDPLDLWYLPPAPYKKISTVVDTHEPLLLVNKSSGLPEGFDPGALATPAVALSKRTSSKVHVIREDITADVEALFAAGLEAGNKLVFVSGYRDRATQKYLWESYAARNSPAEADTYSARPGHSEHETGLAFDLSEESVDMAGLPAFTGTAAASWVAENAWRHGFILRYPAGKEAIHQYVAESWHLRHVGREHARLMYGKRLTLEEYLHERAAGRL